jgi:signal transduction histidine kinase
MGSIIDKTQLIRRVQGAPLWLLDGVLGLAVALVLALVISAEQGGRYRPDALAYGFAAGFGALMLIRRRSPIVVLVGTMVLLIAYYSLDYPSIGLALPLVAALYSAAERGHLAAAIGASIALLIISTYFRLDEGETVAYLLGYELAYSGAFMAAAIALGDSTRSRRALRAEQEQTARLIEQEQALRAEQHLQAERAQIARDLHDLIGHSMSVISLQADVAREVIGSNDAEARQALTHIRATSSQTMRELRNTVKMLRAGGATRPDRSTVSLANLAPLLDNARAAGLAVQLEQQGELAALPAIVDAAAYRIVQEALTNVLRHARASAVRIVIQSEAETLRIEVSDNGQAPPGLEPRGTGIVGMQERARLLGGTLTARPQAGGGFTVNAMLPLTEAP